MFRVRIIVGITLLVPNVKNKNDQTRYKWDCLCGKAGTEVSAIEFAIENSAIEFILTKDYFSKLGFMR